MSASPPRCLQQVRYAPIGQQLECEGRAGAVPHEPLAPLLVIRCDAHRAMHVEPVARGGEASRSALESRVGVASSGDYGGLGGPGSPVGEQLVEASYARAEIRKVNATICDLPDEAYWNADEWTHNDYHGGGYGTEDLTDPFGDMNVNDPVRVARGGGWNASPSQCRVAKHLSANWWGKGLNSRLTRTLGGNETW